MQEKNKEVIQAMFDNIAPNYDRLNHSLSFGMDRYWRKKMVRTFPEHAHRVLDLATGTGDLAIALLKYHLQIEVTAIDFSEKMLNIARKKIQNTPLASRITFQQVDAMALPYEDNFFDVCTVAFGVRNFENLLQGLQEMHRVLKPKGCLLILEFGTPRNKMINQMYKLYSQTWLPRWGGHVSKHGEAYSYLPNSIKEFPCRQDFLDVMKPLQFQSRSYKSLTFGVVNIYKAIK